jgi:hypothetical protein
VGPELAPENCHQRQEINMIELMVWTLSCS